MAVETLGQAGVAELADAQDLKSCGTNLPYRFDSGRRQSGEKSNIYVLNEEYIYVAFLLYFIGKFDFRCML